MLLKLLQGMDHARFSNSVLSLTNFDQIGSRIAELGIPVESLGMRRGVTDLFGFFRLACRMRQIRPHVVQTWLYHADLLGFIAAKMSGNPPLAWNLRCSFMGEDYYRGLSGFVFRSLAWLSRHPNAVVYNSQAGRDLHASRGYQPRRWVLIPNGFDTAQMRPNPDARFRIRTEIGVDQDTPLIGMVGRFDRVKGHDSFLAAAALLFRLKPAARFVLVGAGCTPMNPEIERMMPADVRGAVALLGERHDIADINAALDVATCASIGEGFPNVIGEAMACGVPCVVTDVGDCAEIIGDTGEVVPPGDPAAMTAAWNNILELAPESRITLAAAARSRIVQHYSMKDIITCYEALYSELAGTISA